MHTKRLLMTGAVVLLLFLMAAAGASAGAITDATGLWIYILEDGGAAISGYVGEPPEDLIFPDMLDGYPVTAIDAWAPDEIYLHSVVIPDTVTRIGSGAFSWYCQGVPALTIPESVTHIGHSAFYYCDFTDIRIPVGVTQMGRNPFEGCPITAFEVPADHPVYEQIDGVLFDKQRKMLVSYPSAKPGSVYAVPEGTLYIGDAAFSNNGYLESVTLPDSLIKIGNMSFWACAALAEVTVPEGVTDIGEMAFSECDSLAFVNLPASVVRIGEEAFGWHSDVTLRLYQWSFAEEYALDERVSYVYRPAGSEAVDETGQWRYIPVENGVMLTGYIVEPEGDLVIPDKLDGYTVTAIGEYALGFCGRLTSVCLPVGLQYIGDWVFCECEALTEITVPDSVTGIGVGAFHDTGISTFTIPPGVTYISDNLFGYCFDLAEVIIPAGVTGIGDSAFAQCHALTHVVLPDSVTAIDEYAFFWCSELNRVVIPESVVSIADNAFKDSDEVVLLVKTDSYAMDYAEDNRIDYLYMDDSCQWYYDVYEEHTYILGCVEKPAGKLVIPSELDGRTITGIGEEAFAGCTALTDVILPDYLVWIYDAAFDGCENLARVVLPDSLETIDGDAFAGCTGLLEVIIPAGVSEIDQYAFADCDNLTLIVTEDSYAVQYARENRIPYAYVSQDADKAAFHFGRGEAMYEQGRYEDAEQECAAAVLLEPDNALYWGVYGICLINTEKYEDAHETLSRSLLLAPDDGEVMAYRGLALYLLDRAEEAAEELKRALELEPENNEAYFHAALALFKLGEYEETAQYCLTCLDRLPDGDNVMVLLGDAHFMLGQYQEAVAAYDKAIEYGYHYPGNIAHYFEAALACTYAMASSRVPESVEEIVVANAEELLAALGSDRHILLQEGVYDLTAAWPSHQANSHVFYRECGDGMELVLEKVFNLTIEGVGETPAHIITDPRHAFVMAFEGCMSISIQNIKAGHTNGSACEGGGLSFCYSSNITIDDTLMYGCGTVGLDLYGAADVTVNRSTIYECSAFVMDLYHSTGIQMTDCVFRDNEGGVNIDTVSNLVIDACSFQNNTDYDLLTILQSNAVIVRNTAFIGNDAEELLYQADSEIDLDDSNHFEGNAFD